MKTEFAIWMVSFLLQRKAATKETILQEWSRHRNEACSIHRNTFGNYRKKVIEKISEVLDLGIKVTLKE